MYLGRRPGILDERIERAWPRDRIASRLRIGPFRRTRRRYGARKQRRPVGNPAERGKRSRRARGEGAALRRARMRDGAVDVQPLGHVLRAYVADAATAARGVVGETLGSVGRTRAAPSEHRRSDRTRRYAMPDSMGKRKRRDVTARKHAAREERRVARAGRKKDREAGIIEPGPADRPRRAGRVPRHRRPEGDGEDAAEAEGSESKAAEAEAAAAPTGRRARRSPRSRRSARREELRPRAEVRSGITPVQSGKRRGPDAVRRVLMSFGSNSDGANVRGLRALLALGHVVLDLLVLLQVAETLTGDRAEMHEHVGGTVVRSDGSRSPSRG